jgi:hypothetical protein
MPAPGIAVLIDAENLPPSSLPYILEKISALGKPTVQRCYGDFGPSQLRRWSELASLHGIEIRHQGASGRRKNVSDIQLVIEAMDLLHSGTIDTFCIATNDKDFTPLVTRIRHQGMNAYGLGGNNAAASLQSACTAFIFIDCLSTPSKPRSPRRKTLRPIHEAPPILKKAFSALPGEDGWVLLEQFEDQLHQDDPHFDSRRFGYPSLLQLLRAIRQFRVHQIPQGAIWASLRKQTRGKPPRTSESGKEYRKDGPKKADQP